MPSDRIFQQIDHINSLLPYADKLDDYADAAWLGIRAMLDRLLSSSTYLSQSDHAIDVIKNYADLFGYRMSHDEFISLFKFSLKLAYCPQADICVSNRWLVLAEHMLSSCNWSVPRGDLQLDWRDFKIASRSPIGSLDIRVFSGKLSDKPQLKKLLRSCKRFFPGSCVEEIWREYRAQIFFAARVGPHEDIFNMLIAYTPIRMSTFDEISRVWLGDIFHLWYKYSDSQILNQEIIALLGCVAYACPGRIDWEPHLDRVFNCLVYDFCVDPPRIRGDLSRRDQLVINGYASILVHSIIPGSTTIARMRSLFKVLNSMYHPSMDNGAMPIFAMFCRRLLAQLSNRVRKDLSRCPEAEEAFGPTCTWHILTCEQIDDFVDILLPTCLDANLYTRSPRALRFCTASLRFLAILRPRLLFPRLLEALESGFDRPELPMRVTRPLMGLSEACASATSLDCIIGWNSSDLGRQPADQPRFTQNGGQAPLQQTDDQRSHLTSHLSQLINAEGRSNITRILRCCIAGLDMNDSDRLWACLKALGTLFLTTPMQDFSESCLPGISDAAPLAACPLQPDFAASRIALATLEMEDLAVQAYTRILSCMVGVNETAHLRMAANEGQHTEEMALSPKAQDSRLLCSITGLAVTLGLAASPVPRLRRRLVKLLTDALFSNQWTKTNARLLNYQLLWFINGKRGASVGAEAGADVAVEAIREFWPRFLRLFEELDNENGLTCRGKAEPRFLGLLGVLPAFITALVPSRLVVAATEFIYPLITVISRLLTVSIGAAGKFDPCHDLAVSAASCAGVLFHRLLAYSINFDTVDVLHTQSHRPPEESSFLTNPLWTPYVSWRDLLAQNPASSLWNQPTPEGFAIAEHAVRILLLPVLAQLTAATAELEAYTHSETPESTPPQIPQTSGQSSSAQQRQYLVDLTTWFHMLSVGLFESLKPRDVTHADAETVRRVCAQLDLARTAVMEIPSGETNCPIFQLDFPWFDVPVTVAGDKKPIRLREHLLRVGLGLLQVFAKLSSKYDALVIDSSSQTNGQSIAGSLFSPRSLDYLLSSVFAACFNDKADDSSPSHVVACCSIVNLAKDNLGASACTFLAPTSAGSSENFLPSILRVWGTPQVLLEAYARGEAPSTRCAGGGYFLAGAVPLAWLVKARQRHLDFVRLALNRGAVWPGFEASAAVYFTRLPVSAEHLRLMEVCTQLGLVSNNERLVKSVVVCLTLFGVQRIPGGISFVFRKVIETLRELFDRSFLSDRDTVYRTQRHRRHRAFVLLCNLFRHKHTVAYLYDTNPELWSEAWVTLGKTAIFTQITDDTSSNSSENSTSVSQDASARRACALDAKAAGATATKLTGIELTHRYTDQEGLSKTFLWLFETFTTFAERLYFPTSYRLADHVPGSPIHGLVGEAVELRGVVADAAARREIVESSPPLLGLTVALRRASHGNLIRGLYDECLAPTDLMANSSLAARLLQMWPFPWEPPEFSPLDARFRDQATQMVVRAPPPPPPPAAMVRMALGMLTAQQTELAHAAMRFIRTYLSTFLERSRHRKLILMGPRGVVRDGDDVDAAVEVSENPERVPGVREDNFDLVFDPSHQPLSSDAEFRKHHHVTFMNRGFVYFKQPQPWVDPLYSPAYPTFSHDDDSQLVATDTAWLEPRPEMDFASVYSASDVADLRDSLTAIAVHFASRHFWPLFAHRFLNFHRCSDQLVINNTLHLIRSVADCLGPRPLLPRLEQFVLTLLEPGISPSHPDVDGVAEFVGPNIASDVIMAMALGSASWPRAARLILHTCTLPRLLVAIEGACLFASTRRPSQSLGEGIHAGLNKVQFVSVSLGFGNGGAVADEVGPSKDGIPTVLQRSVNNPRLYGILMENRQFGGDDSDSVSPAPGEAGQRGEANGFNRSGGGSGGAEIKSRLPFFYVKFVRNYVVWGFSQPDYLAYLWQFARALMDDGGAGSNTGPDRLPTHVEPMNYDNDDSEACPPPRDLLFNDPAFCRSQGHPAPLDGGACPLCVGRQFLPSRAQRRFFFHNLTVALLRTFRWAGLKVISQAFGGTNGGICAAWERLVNSPSIWDRDNAACLSVVLSAANFDSIVRQVAPRVCVFSLDEAPKRETISRAEIVRRELKHPAAAVALLQSLNAEKALIGQDFVYRRFLPILVRDSIAVLLLRGVQPSANTYAVQSSLMSMAIMPYVEATPEITEVTPEIKRMASQHIKSRLCSLFHCLSSILNFALPENPLESDSPKAPASIDALLTSRAGIFTLIAPILADFASTSDLFWTGGRSEVARGASAGDTLGDLEVSVGRAVNDLGRMVCTGHTEAALSFKQASRLLDCIEVFTSHESWKTRAFGMLMLRVMPVANLSAFLSSAQEADGLRQRVKRLSVGVLADPWVEVSRSACEALSILVRYGILEYNDQWFAHLVRQSRLPLAARGQRAAVPSANPPAVDPTTTTPEDVYQTALRNRHAGILGLCAFIKANLHDTPSYLPAVIAEVAEHCNDPQPIAKSVSDTLMAYSRSHLERWSEERHKFTEAQLDAYQSVVSSVSYYV